MNKDFTSGPVDVNDVRTRIHMARFNERDTLMLLLLADISEKLDSLLCAMDHNEEEEVGS